MPQSLIVAAVGSELSRCFMLALNRREESKLCFLFAKT
jgi:hypothetical protein